ncbi:Stage V sporulation protein K [Koleobacter methoxysyntrophicus]|uniref:Stage V sporulation protein K n=1 Tax=Koleobacter methoxysyntrophicus TaxID=2751313 RepID=A0A8A0RJF9_9FIRM|nr:AAA family ATPase [Koleobacter methoxysyntrophicus]QSQ07689.1 Stage V sporulation protein K [Koleobacter methoxysyntrophicus]
MKKELKNQNGSNGQSIIAVIASEKGKLKKAVDAAFFARIIYGFFLVFAVWYLLKEAEISGYLFIVLWITFALASLYFLSNNPRNGLNRSLKAAGFDKLKFFCSYYSTIGSGEILRGFKEPTVYKGYDGYWQFAPGDVPELLKELRKKTTFIAVLELLMMFIPVYTLYYFLHNYYPSFIQKLDPSLQQILTSGNAGEILNIIYIPLFKALGVIAAAMIAEYFLMGLKYERAFVRIMEENALCFRSTNKFHDLAKLKKFDTVYGPMWLTQEEYDAIFKRDLETVTQNNKKTNKNTADRFNDNIIPPNWKEPPKSNRDQIAKNLLTEALNDLDNLVGLEEVKQQVRRFIATMQAYLKKKEAGYEVMRPSLHMVFAGPPGTGKTTVARNMAKILKALGFLSSGHLVETDRSGLVAGYVGQTASKTQEKIAEALGGVLFIDEAYSLLGGSDQDYGREAVSTLIKAMEDHRDNFVVIFAGYSAEMEKFLKSNPGLRSRVPYKFTFTDYGTEEISQIIIKKLEKQGHKIKGDAVRMLKATLKEFESPDGSIKGSGRFARNFIDRILEAQNFRIGISCITDPDSLMEITSEDVKEGAVLLKKMK